MMRIEEEEDNMAASSSQSPPDAANAAANAVGKGGRKGKGKSKDRREQYVRSILQTKDAQKVTNVLVLTPRRPGSILDAVLLVMT